MPQSPSPSSSPSRAAARREDRSRRRSIIMTRPSRGSCTTRRPPALRLSPAPSLIMADDRVVPDRVVVTPPQHFMNDEDTMNEDMGHDLSVVPPGTDIAAHVSAAASRPENQAPPPIPSPSSGTPAVQPNQDGSRVIYEIGESSRSVGGNVPEKNQTTAPKFQSISAAGFCMLMEKMVALQELIPGSSSNTTNNNKFNGICLLMDEAIDQMRALKSFVHYQTFRKDILGEKLNLLQQLIPGSGRLSNVTGETTLLDDTMKYLKSLQIQVQLLTSTNRNDNNTCNTCRYNMTNLDFPPSAGSLPLHLAMCNNIDAGINGAAGIASGCPIHFATTTTPSLSPISTVMLYLFPLPSPNAAHACTCSDHHHHHHDGANSPPPPPQAQPNASSENHEVPSSSGL